MTAVVIGAVVLMLSVWGWRRSTRATVQALVGTAVVLAMLSASAYAGWDPDGAVGELGLLVGAVTLAWLASRTRPPENFPALLAVGLAGLTIWGIWQVATGFEMLRPGLEALPDTARSYFEERLDSGRAFASLPLPSHLAVLLATALPLLLTRVRATPGGIVWAIGAVLAGVGVIATRSPIGMGLAIAASTAVMIGRNRRLVVVVVLLLVIALGVVVVARSDVMRLDPVTLRVDNWRTALWLWSTAPVDGVGVGSFAQATQAMPLMVGNRPAHAHNLPLEGLAELGPVGLMGCLALGYGLLWLIRALWVKDRALAVSLAVVPLHNLLDFSFFVTGVAFPWAVLAGWGIARSSQRAAAGEGPGGRALVVAACAMAVGIATLHATSVVVEWSAASRPEHIEQFDGALRSIQLAPWRVEPQFLLSASALATGDSRHLDRAWIEMDTKRWLRPRSAALAERRARVALARGAASIAVAELWGAMEMGAADPNRSRSFCELLRELEGGTGAVED